MFINPIKFYLINQGRTDNLEADLNKIISFLESIKGITITRDKKGKDFKILISYPQIEYKASLEIDKKKSDMPPKIILTCEKSDDITINLIRNVIKYTNCKIFNPLLNSFLTNDPNLVDLTTAKMDKNLKLFFKTISVKPLFQYKNSLNFFVMDKKNKNIYLVNRYLIEYFLKLGRFDEKAKDLITKVADNINVFIALFDRGLINTDFYKTLFKKDRKIINLSGFDIKKLPRNILIIPIVFKLNKASQTFDENRSFSQPMDILKKGDNIQKYVLELLGKKTDKDILVTKINTDINYEENFKGIKKRIPRLTVSVFMN